MAVLLYVRARFLRGIMHGGLHWEGGGGRGGGGHASGPYLVLML